MLPRFTTLGRGPVLLMLHDVDGSHLAFAPQVESFATQGYQAVAWDMPGYGHSPPIEPYDFKGLAARCVALIEALTQRPDGSHASVILLGQGMGGMVAQEVVLRRPELVNRLILISTLGAFDDVPAAQRDAYVNDRTIPLEAGVSMRELAQRLVPRQVGPGSLPEGALLAEHALGGVYPSIFRCALDALLRFDRRGALSNVRVPTLLLSGEFDAIATPERVQAIALDLPMARCTVLRGVGRWPNLEAPEDFDSAVLSFLSDTAPGMQRTGELH
ncbi:alpha/beta fold hydrolase [Ottowia caeni]|uniref:alpha/beta fold hydrolase n=1 Tax=Ottowia caeni TaxID=2870339 RepID=UPI001E2D6265|nr:alpha/beta hydrolase [Ottowia caeni]